MAHPKNKHERNLMGRSRALKLLKIYRSRSDKNANDPFFSDDGKLAKRLAHTRVPCSCVGCGNARKWEGLTKQELIAALNELDQLELK